MMLNQIPNEIWMNIVKHLRYDVIVCKWMLLSKDINSMFSEDEYFWKMYFENLLGKSYFKDVCIESYEKSIRTYHLNKNFFDWEKKILTRCNFNIKKLLCLTIDTRDLYDEILTDISFPTFKRRYFFWLILTPFSSMFFLIDEERRKEHLVNFIEIDIYKPYDISSDVHNFKGFDRLTNDIGDSRSTLSVSKDPGFEVLLNQGYAYFNIIDPKNKYLAFEYHYSNNEDVRSIYNWNEFKEFKDLMHQYDKLETLIG